MRWTALLSLFPFLHDLWFIRILFGLFLLMLELVRSNIDERILGNGDKIKAKTRSSLSLYLSHVISFPLCSALFLYTDFIPYKHSHMQKLLYFAPKDMNITNLWVVWGQDFPFVLIVLVVDASSVQVFSNIKQGLLNLSKCKLTYMVCRPIILVWSAYTLFTYIYYIPSMGAIS